MSTGILRLRSPVALAEVSASVEHVDEIVARLRRGDPAALASAYDRYHLMLRNFARRLLGDSGEAEDLVQEVFISLPRAISRFEGRCAFGTFLVSIAVNHARHYVRSATRRRRALANLASEVPVAPRDPECTARERQEAGALFRALDDLPLDQRVAFVLCEIEERSAGEAAEIVGTSDGNIRARVFHARRRLRDLLAGEVQR